jgi:hypothetical protein
MTQFIFNIILEIILDNYYLVNNSKCQYKPFKKYKIFFIFSLYKYI